MELLIPQKCEIIEYSKKFPKASQKSMILKFNKEFNTTIASSTIGDILKQDNIRKLENLENVDDYNKRIRDAKYPDLENFIFHIFYIKVLLNKNFFKIYRIRLSEKLVIRNDFFLPNHSGLARENCIPIPKSIYLIIIVHACVYKMDTSIKF